MPDSDRTARARRALVAFASLLTLLAVTAPLALLPTGASAHGRSLSYSSFEIDAQGADVSLRMPLLELSRLGPDALPPGTLGERDPGGDASLAAPDGPKRLDAAGDATADAFARRLVLRADGLLCPLTGPARRQADVEGWVRYAWRVACATEGRALEVESAVLLDVAPSHLHFARVRFAGAPEAIREQVLTEGEPVFVVRATGSSTPAEAVGSRFADYLLLGVRHILSGWDHLAFLAGLVLLADRLGAIARLVTGFTLAHSLTLALSVLGIVSPRAAAIEAVIAFSVALVAIEKGWRVAGRPRAVPLAVLVALGLLAVAGLVVPVSLPAVTLVGLMLFTGCYFALAAGPDQERLRIALTFAFGLVHGFGFAGVLARLELPTERLVPALLGFNLGVEIGQIAVVLVAWPTLVLATRLTAPAWQRFARDLATAGLCGLGCFWLIERAFSF